LSHRSGGVLDEHVPSLKRVAFPTILLISQESAVDSGEDRSAVRKIARELRPACDSPVSASPKIGRGIVVIRNRKLGNNKAIVMYVITLIVVIVGVDVLFLSHHFAVRLIVNIGIVLVFAVVSLKFLKRS
jgi:hypothetical protein